MKNVTCQAFLTNPKVREQLEQEARHARAEAVHGLVLAPLMRMLKQMFHRPAPVAVHPMHVAA